MPIYEYQCPKCGTFETSQRITEPALRKCPTCKSKVTKLISNTSFQLKGSGWYVTDYASKGGSGGDSKKKGSDEGGKAEKTDKSESKSDSKSEAKSDSKSETSSKKESSGKTEATAA
jgi:putative FmdB family regulatory protein